MAKQFKKFNVKNHTGFYVDRTSGEEKKELRTIGEIVVFSDQPIPEDLSILVKMYDKCHSGINPLSVWEDKPRQQTGSQEPTF